MKRFIFRRFLYLLVIAGLVFPLSVFGQAKAGASGQAPGWGSEWVRPANEEQRQESEFLKQCDALIDAHKYQAAVDLCDRAIQKAPDDPVRLISRACVFGAQKQFERALADANRAYALAQQKQLVNLSAKILISRAWIHWYQRDIAAEARDLQASLKLNPNNPSPLNDLAWLRATSLDSALRNGPESVRLAKKAVELSTKDTYAPIDTLAASYAEAGDYKRAVECEKRAIAAGSKEIKAAGKALDFQRQASDRLRLFEQHQPYHAAPKSTL